MTPDLFRADSISIPVISLWQPWASWVILGWKTIETRTHNRFAGLVGKRIGIHASQKWDKQADRMSDRWMSYDRQELTRDWWRDPAWTGSLLGTVEVVESRILTPEDAPAAKIECDTLRFGLFLKNPIQFAKAIPLSGKQGIFRYTLDEEPQRFCLNCESTGSVPSEVETATGYSLCPYVREPCPVCHPLS